MFISPTLLRWSAVIKTLLKESAFKLRDVVAAVFHYCVKYTSAVVTSLRTIITQRPIHAMFSEGRWLTVSIYQTSSPCWGGVPSLCARPCLWSMAFLSPVYTAGWKNLITHTLTNHNSHFTALSTLHAGSKCLQSLTDHCGQKMTKANNKCWEMTHTCQICCESQMCHKFTSLSTVDFSTAVTLSCCYWPTAWEKEE